MKLYQYPNCSTCRKAIKFLDAKQIDYVSVNITEQPPTEAELRAMLNSYDGQIRKLFNTSGLQYRELDMKNKLPSMSNDEAISLLSKNGKLIKRPFLIDEKDNGIVAFKEPDWERFFA